ncbi:MAG: hypothetical protein KFF73_13865 [Cyclobacteriaceae bacterium]|nr:hypothetical protein [Cyclobacteriaceae bacterium]
MQKYHIFLFTVLLILCSCKKSPERDLSLSVEEYKKLGMADPTRTWKHEDYRQAYVVLSQLRSDRPGALPRKGSNKSGKYFDRLISMDNISFLKDDAMPLMEKAMQIQSYILIQSDLTGIYTNENSQDQFYNRELIELYLFGLSIMEQMLQLSQKINESDEEEVIRMQTGLPTLRFTYLTQVAFILEKQKNSSTYLTKDLERLTDSLYNSVVKNRIWMEASTRANLEKQMLVVMDSVSSKHVRNKYENLIEILSKDPS